MVVEACCVSVKLRINSAVIFGSHNRPIYVTVRTVVGRENV